MDIQRKKNLAALLSVISNGFLVIAKLIVGIAIGSVSVISEAIHSGVDVVAAALALYGVVASGQPADKKHPFGHGKFENLSSLAQALLIFIASGWIIYEAIHKIMSPQKIETIGIGVLIMCISSIVNAAVAYALLKVAKETDSAALKADAWHCLTDVYTSAGVMAGLLIIWIGKALFPSVHLEWVDPVVAMVVALFIIKAAWDLSIESIHDLLDASLPQKEEEEIKRILRSYYPNLIGYHNFRSRKSGSVRFVEFHLIVEPTMPVDDSHKLHHAIEDEISSLFPESEIMVHIEPCDNLCPDYCVSTCFKKNIITDEKVSKTSVPQ